MTELTWQPSNEPSLFMYGEQEECVTDKGTFYIWKYGDEKELWGLLFRSKRQFEGDRKWWFQTMCADREMCIEEVERVLNDYENVKAQYLEGKA